MSSSILAQKALAIPEKVRQSYLLGIAEVELHGHVCRLLENMDSGAKCEITHGRDEYGRDVVLRRTSPFGHEYIAVVVKRGDTGGKISGRTAGPIDEIISQANQSVAHPCFLKEIEIAKVEIGAVMVMFFGRLTGNAAKRIIEEAPRGILKTFPIEWLNESFAKHFPEVFFAGAASTYLQEKVIEFETQHDLSRRPENLSDWYVDPSVAITHIDASTFNERLKRALKLRRLSYRQFRGQLTSSRRFVLSGSPGLGKSTLLRKLALDMYREAMTASASFGSNIRPGSIEIPVLVSAVDLLEHASPSSFIEEFLPPTEVRASFRVGCLLVDALDEVAGDSQAAALEAAVQLAEYLDCSMVISARPVHVVRSLADQGSPRLPVVQLLPFEFKQALQLIGRLVNDREIVEILKEGIANLRSQMSLSPLSVSLLLDIAEAEREIPGTVGEIFEQYVDIALGRYDFERGIEVVFQYFIKKQLLSELAFTEFFNKRRLRIEHAEFVAFIDRYCESRGFDATMISRMQADIDRSDLVRFGDDVYFAHRSFLDFFVAFYVDSHASELGDFDKYLAKIYLDDRWSEVAFYVFARRRELVPGFVDAIVAAEVDDVDYHLRRFSLGRLLQAAWLSASEVKRNGVEIGAQSAPRLFEMVSGELRGDAPPIVPYGVVMGLAERAYSSRTLWREVSVVVDGLTSERSLDALRSAVNLLWAVRSRMPTPDLVRLADGILALMADLEKAGDLELADKTVSLLLLEIILEDDKKLQRSVVRRLERLMKRQPEFIKKLITV